MLQLDLKYSDVQYRNKTPTKLYLHDKPSESNFDGCCEKVSWKVWVHGQQLVLGAGSQLDTVPERWRRRELCCSCLRSSSSDLLHILPLMLLSKVLETVHNDASIVTVIDIDTWGAQPALQVIYRQRYVLSVGPTCTQGYLYVLNSDIIEHQPG